MDGGSITVKIRLCEFYEDRRQARIMGAEPMGTWYKRNLLISFFSIVLVIL